MKTIPVYKSLSLSQKRDFLAYCKNLPKVGMPEYLTTDIVVKSLAHWYSLWDTYGIKAKHPRQELCWRLVQSKAQLNLTIKLWVEDIVNELCILYPYEVKEYCKNHPVWVWKSFVNQLSKHCLPFKWQQIV